MSDVPRYAFGGFELDLGRFELRQGDTPIDLEPKALAVLRLLVERAPHVVDKAEIFAQAWKDTAVSDNALTRVVAQLRKALGDDAKDPRYIATIASRGYRLLPTVRRLEAETPVPAVGAPVAEPTAPIVLPRPAARWWRRPMVLAAILAVSTLSAVGIWLAFRTPAAAAAATRSSIGGLDVAIAASLMAQQLTTAGGNNGYDGYAAFSPDGTSIAYASDRSGRFEIYVEGLAEGATPTSLTGGVGQCIHPAWSPDGRFIAYHDMSGNGIWVRPSRGGVAHKVADFGAHPTFSPDGRRIVFQSRPPSDVNAGGAFGSDSTLFIADVEGRAPPRALTMAGTPVGSHGLPQWWPGSDRVLFVVISPVGARTRFALWTIAPDSGELRQLSAHERLSPEFVAAPDGTGVLFVSRGTNALWWLPVEHGVAGEPRPTALPVTGPLLSSLAITPDGRRVAWTATGTSSGLFAAPVRMGGAAGPGTGAATPTPVVRVGEVGGRAGSPAVSSHGRVAFAGNRGNGTSNIFVVEPGGAPRQITTDGGDHFVPFWIAGEDALVVFGNHGDGPAWWRLDPTTGREQLLFRDRDVPRPPGVETLVLGAAMSTSISKDLSHVAIAYITAGIPNLWTAPLGPRGPAAPLVQRTSEPVNGSFASWSPDARFLAYQCTRDGSLQICVLDVANPATPPVQLTHEAGTRFMGEWQDDDWIIFAAKREALWNVMSVSRSTGTVSVLTAFTEPRFYVRYPRWDPSRQRVVFEQSETTGRLWSVRLPAAATAAGSAGSRPGR